MSVRSEVIIIDETDEKDKKVGGLWCKVCEYALVSHEDVKCDKQYGCCEECWLTFGQMRQKEWNQHWRPDSETLNRYKQARRIINIDITKFLGE